MNKRLSWMAVGGALLGSSLGACATTDRTDGSPRVPHGYRFGGSQTNKLDRSPSAAGTDYLNDADHDPDGDADSDYAVDDDYDLSQDKRRSDNKSYHESDDASIVAYGHTASPNERQAITALVKRYDTLVASADGADACAMLLPSLARTVGSDYGGPAGPRYLRGRSMCKGVSTEMFKHGHTQLAGTLVVTEVRRDGANAVVLLGSRYVPAAYLPLQRLSRRWRVDSLTASPLP
jgi:hypothetical protein